MYAFRQTIDEGFGRWARTVGHHPWLWILATVVVALILATRIPLMSIETSTEDYLFDSDPAKIAYDSFREQFGRDQPVLILIEPPEVFDLEFLHALGELHRDLEDSVPHLNEITSLVNVRSVYGREDELLVDDLLEEMPSTPEELAALKERVLDTPSYLDSVISRDGRIAALIVEANAYSEPDLPADELAGFGEESQPVELEVLTGRENFAFSTAVLEVLERHRRDDFVVHLTGQPLLAFALTLKMSEDVPRIFGGALLLIGALIVILFRRFSPVLLASAVVVLSLLSTLGLAQLCGIPISLTFQVLPSFILAVGVGYAVHVMTIFFKVLAETEDREVALEFALRHTGLPILMTGVTTASGLLSFLAAEMEQVLQFGVGGAIGVACTLIYSLVFLPAVLVALPLSPGRSKGLEGGNVLLTACARLSVRHPWELVGVTGLLAIGSLALIPSLDYSADVVRYFQPDHWLRQATHFADERMGGMQSLEVVIDTGRENGLHEPAFMEGLEALNDRVALLRSRGELFGTTASVLDVQKETHQALNENREEFYRVPGERELIAQELLLFENSGSDDLEDLVDSQFSKARISIRTEWEDGVEKARALDRITPEILEVVGGLGEVELTGSVVLVARTADVTVSTLIRSYALALLLITPLMMLLIGSFRAGLVSMVPNLVPIMATLALMVLTGIELDLFTVLGACIAIGLAVDDSIHFITGFRRHLAETNDPARSVELTMATTGRALLFTSVTLVAAFIVLGLSTMSNLANLGMLTAFAIGLAFVLDVTVTPALLVLTHRRR